MGGSQEARTGRKADAANHAMSVNRRRLLQSAMAGAASIPIARHVAAQATPVPSRGAQFTPLGADAFETWDEPWVWRPSDWPGQQLDLNVVENENPGEVVGFGNPSAVLFSYNGATPGPTIRMRGDETLLLKLRNVLGQNFGSTFVGPYPDPNALPKSLSKDLVAEKAKALGNLHHDYCLGEHTNGVHSERVTNIHTHGLHVRPGRNPDGTHSDNVILRIIPEADLEKREEQAASSDCEWLRDPEQVGYLREDETTGFADYEFRIGNVQQELREADGLPPQAHPPGTHWYHPHTHGSTHNQVSSGMAGFLVVEGDVDEAINLELAGERHPDPQIKTGPYDYIERLMLIQRVFVTANDPDAPTKTLKGGGAASSAVNGDQTPEVITMRPGAIERWRVLNGSVDGQGYKRVMVLKGQYEIQRTPAPGGGQVATLVKVRANGEATPASRAEVSADKQQLYQLAFDGVTLVEGSGDDVRYTIQDLAQQNAGTENPLDREVEGNPNQAMLANVEACFADADSVRNTFVRPNEVYLAPGNRSDLLFKAPRLASGAASDVYTVLARAVVVHADNYQSSLQAAFASDDPVSVPEDIIVAHVVVADDTDDAGDPLPAIPDYDVIGLVDVLPEVPQYLRPIEADEMRVRDGADGSPASPDAALPDRVGKYRTRTIVYSGWGAADFPLVTTEGDSETARNFRAFVERDQASGGTLEDLRYTKLGDTGAYMLLAPNIRSMAITGSTSSEVVDDSDELFPITAGMGRKFSPNDPLRPRMLENTAEEWAIYNYSISLWADTSKTNADATGGHYPGQPLTRAEGQARFAEQPPDAKTWTLQTKGVDHPFHMHQNPYWVMRIEIPDQNGDLVNILDRPRWQDVVWVPRNGGRVVFRSRYPDYVGRFVNHCHILLHEDNGMMQVVEVTPFADMANYEAKDGVAPPEASAEEVSSIYPRYDQARAWLQSMQFVDINHETGQAFPGFVLGPPPSGE